MYTSVTIQTRASTDIEFWSKKPPVYVSHVIKQYVNTGKFVRADTQLSEDNLELTTKVDWRDENAYVEFSSDPVIVKEYIDPFNSYSANMGIKVKLIDTKNKMVNRLGPSTYPRLHVPDTWANVDEFAEWWLSNGMPMIFEQGTEVFVSDDATSIALFRKGRFQAELYLIHPNPMVPVHEHPEVEVIKVRLDGKKYPYLSNTLRKDQSHGAGLRLEADQRGFPLIAIQHWLTREPTTIASMWKGNTVGPKQEALIRRFNPTAWVEPGYADITQTLNAATDKSRTDSE